MSANPYNRLTPCLWKQMTNRRWMMQYKKLEPILLAPKSLFSMLRNRRSLVPLALAVPFSIALSVCQFNGQCAKGFPLTKQGSGIFVSPAIVLKTTGSVGVSLLLWTLGAVVGMSALCIWLELGLSVPKFELVNHEETETSRQGEETLQCVPRNGGEKNYVCFLSPRAAQTY